MEGISENLELEAGKDLARLPREIDLIVSTGCVGYVTEATFRKILSHLEESQPWIASFVLQIFDYQPIADCVAHYGYRSQQLRHRTFRQRRFKNVQEQLHMEQILHAKDVQDHFPSDFRSDGYLYAEFFLSQPASEADSAVWSTF